MYHYITATEKVNAQSCTIQNDIETAPSRAKMIGLSRIGFSGRGDYGFISDPSIYGFLSVRPALSRLLSLILQTLLFQSSLFQ